MDLERGKSWKGGFSAARRVENPGEWKTWKNKERPERLFRKRVGRDLKTPKRAGHAEPLCRKDDRGRESCDGYKRRHREDPRLMEGGGRANAMVSRGGAERNGKPVRLDREGWRNGRATGKY